MNSQVNNLLDMRIKLIIILSILLTLSSVVLSKNSDSHFNHFFSLKINSIPNDSAIISQHTDNGFYKLIILGKEEKIKKYFREVTLETLCKNDSGTIAKAFNRINTNDKVTKTIWILEEIKNRNPEIRAYVYNELLRINYKKPPFLLKHLINNYFTNYNEPIDTLKTRINKLQKKMNKELWF